MPVVIADTAEQMRPHRLRRADGVQQSGDKAHMAEFQRKCLPGQGKTLDRQRDRLCRDAVIHRADALQPHLADFLERMALLRGAVYIFQVIKPPALSRLHRGVFGDGQRHIRLECQQASIQIRKGDDLLAGKKAPVLLIQAVFFKPAHPVLLKPCLLVQHPKLQGDPLLRPERIQIQFHHRGFLLKGPRPRVSLRSFYFILLSK